MNEMFQTLIAQNKLMLEEISKLQQMVGELRQENIRLEEQVKLSVALSKSTSPIYDEETRKEAFMEAVRIDDVMKERENNALDPNIIR